MSLLQNSTKGILKQAPIIIIYGDGGLGKDTWASHAPSPYFIDVEGGTGNLDVVRSPKPKTYDEAVSYIDAILTEKHDFKTLVLSGLDTLQNLLIQKIISEDHKNPKGLNQAAGGFGNGPKVLLEMFASLTAKLSAVRAEKGMQIICVGHPITYTCNDPNLPSGYDKMGLNLYEDGKVSVRELFFNWADAVFYVKKKLALVADTRRASDLEVGRHYIYTQERAAFKAKSRYPLPFELELNYGEFEKAMKHVKTAPELVKEIETLAQEIKEEALRSRINNAVQQYKSSSHDLANILEQVKTILSKA